MKQQEQTAEFIFGSWTTPEVDVKIEYPLEVMDELRVAATDGLQRLSRGGLEVGGVLFGTRRGSSVRILTWRPIECEHAHGPGFVLSHKDRANVTRLLDVAQTDHDLQGLTPVGWFLSHTRSDLVLSPANVDFFNLFFPWGWQITLVLRPGRLGEARGGIFVREADGSLRTESSYREFTIEPLRRDAPAAARTPRALEPLSREKSVETDEPPPAAQPEIAKTRARGPSLWLWAIPGCLALLIGGVLLKDRFLTPAPADPSIAFRVLDEGNSLRLEWKRDSPAARSAREAVVEIKDGAATSRIVLTPQRLREGNVEYGRQTGDVELSITVYPSGGGNPERESARFVGPPVAGNQPQSPEQTEAPASGLQAERDRLDAELRRLRSNLSKETERANHAEDMVRILENRIQVENARKADAPAK
jgi:hypothetical protein